MVLAFNDIQSDYYQLPSDDKEKIRLAEEKIREELKEKTLDVNQDTVKTDDNAENNDEKIKILIIKLIDDEKQDYREKVKSSFGIKEI